MIARHILDEVSDVVQQRGNDERRRRAGDLREVRGLQGVLGHRDALAEIGARTAPVKDGENFVGDVHERCLRVEFAAQQRRLANTRCRASGSSRANGAGSFADENAVRPCRVR